MGAQCLGKILVLNEYSLTCTIVGEKQKEFNYNTRHRQQ